MFNNFSFMRKRLENEKLFILILKLYSFLKTVRI
jgi:hypothetical protein